MSEAYKPKDQLSIWCLANPAQPRLVGELALQYGGRGVTLRYAASWRESGFALSEDLPLTDELFVPKEKDTAVGAVDDARPDRWGERIIRKFEVSPRMSVLEYLLFVGDDRYGALGVSRAVAHYAPWQQSPMPKIDSLDEMAQVVRKVLTNEPVPEAQRRLIRPGASLGGARPKSLVEIDGDAWLVKFSEGEEIDTPLVEHATMQLARLCGVNTADTRVFTVGSGHAVTVRRFDRVNRFGKARIHAVSSNVALKATGNELSYVSLAQLLRRVAPAAAIAGQQAQLFRRMVFNILIDNTDDHEKNHALLRQPDGSYLLAPAFDVVPSAQGLGYQAMAIGEQGTVSSLANALSSARLFGLKDSAARQIVGSICEQVDGWKAHFTGLGVSGHDIDVLAQYIDGQKLGGQRHQQE